MAPKRVNRMVSEQDLEALRNIVQNFTPGLAPRVDALEKKASTPGPKGEKGDKGEAGTAADTAKIAALQSEVAVLKATLDKVVNLPSIKNQLK